MLDRGHALHPHTADTILEAWGPTIGACFEEAVHALAESFVTVGTDANVVEVDVSIDPAPLDEQLALLLDEVVYLVDTRDLVAVDARVAIAPDGRIAGVLHAVQVDDVESVGPMPKGVSFEGLDVVNEGDEWRCHVTIDV